jgi:hypothetical protein
VPAIARQFVGEILRIADAEDLRRGIMPETPGREGDRGQQRLQVARGSSPVNRSSISPASSPAGGAVRRGGTMDS